eukprot:2537276-Rhodomonas_salina.1
MTIAASRVTYRTDDNRHRRNQAQMTVAPSTEIACADVYTPRCRLTYWSETVCSAHHGHPQPDLKLLKIDGDC